MYIFIPPPLSAFCPGEEGGLGRVEDGPIPSQSPSPSPSPPRLRAERPRLLLCPCRSMAREAALAACLEAVLGDRCSANRVFELLEPLAVRAGPHRTGPGRGERAEGGQRARAAALPHTPFCRARRSRSTS